MLDPPPPPIAHGAIVVILGFSRADVAVAATRGCGRDGRGEGASSSMTPRRAAPPASGPTKWRARGRA